MLLWPLPAFYCASGQGVEHNPDPRPEGSDLIPPGRYAQGDHEHDAFPFCMGGKEVGNIVVVEGDATGPKTEGVSAKVHFATYGPSLQLGGAITSVPVTLKDSLQVSHEEHHSAGVGAQGLLETKVARLFSKGPFPQ